MLGIFHFWGWLLHGTNQCTGAYTEADKKKGQPVKVGLDSVGTRMFAGFPEMVPGAGIEPARLSAGDFESPEVFISMF